VGSNSPRDIQPDYSKELKLAEDPDALIERVDLILTHGTMSDETKNLIRGAIESVSINPGVLCVVFARFHRSEVGSKYAWIQTFTP
jgi:hypothetical protein